MQMEQLKQGTRSRVERKNAVIDFGSLQSSQQMAVPTQFVQSGQKVIGDDMFNAQDDPAAALYRSMQENENARPAAMGHGVGAVGEDDETDEEGSALGVPSSRPSARAAGAMAAGRSTATPTLPTRQHTRPLTRAKLTAALARIRRQARQAHLAAAPGRQLERDIRRWQRMCRLSPWTDSSPEKGCSSGSSRA